jgi:hypothetical protein
VPFGTWQTLTFVAALRCDELTAPLVIEGAMNGGIFQVGGAVPEAVPCAKHLPSHNHPQAPSSRAAETRTGSDRAGKSWHRTLDLLR